MNLFIDTNVFLSFFHLTNDDLEELRKLSVLLDKNEVTLLLPKQVEYEFRRNRENKINDSLKRLRDQQLKLQFPQVCKDYYEYNQLRSLQSEYQKNHAKLIKAISDDVIEGKLKADIIIKELFGKSTIIECDDELICKAQLRTDIGNPPGKNGSLGDAINWEALLSYDDIENDIHIVTDDKDFHSVLDKDRFNEFLNFEWQEVKNTKLYYYKRLSLFFRENYPDIKLASEFEKELQVRKFTQSGSFQDTHAAILTLSKYSEFSLDQINEIVHASYTNSQISWIIDDDDVYDFVKKIVLENRALITKENLEGIEEYIDLEVGSGTGCASTVEDPF